MRRLSMFWSTASPPPITNGSRRWLAMTLKRLFREAPSQRIPL